MKSDRNEKISFSFIMKIFNLIYVNLKVHVCEAKNKFLPPPPSDEIGYSCCGGVVVETQDEKISLDNTLDAYIYNIL